MKQFKIKPNTKDLQVIDPETMRPLKAAGEQKPRSEYWLRRQIEGDVVEITPETKTATKEKRK